MRKEARTTIWSNHRVSQSSRRLSSLEATYLRCRSLVRTACLTSLRKNLEFASRLDDAFRCGSLYRRALAAAGAEGMQRAIEASTWRSSSIHIFCSRRKGFRTTAKSVHV